MCLKRHLLNGVCRRLSGASVECYETKYIYKILLQNRITVIANIICGCNKRCQEHFEKYSKKLEQIEKVLQSKLNKEEVVALIEEKQELDNKVVTKQQKKQIMDFVNSLVSTGDTGPQPPLLPSDIVKEQLPKDSVNKDDIRVIIDGEFEENEKLASDRQSRERNIVIFRMDEPQTNLVIERQAKDKEVVKGVIDHMGIETEEEVNIEKIIRLGGRSVNYKEQPRPMVVTFSNIDSKKNFLRRSNALKNSENEIFKKVAPPAFWI